MKVKHSLTCLMIVLSAIFGFSSCSDNDVDTPDILQKENLTFTYDLVRVKIGAENRIALPIATGAGEYNAYSFDPEIADVVTGEDGTVYIEGYKNGSTTLIVSDAANNYKRLGVGVYTTDELKLSHTEFNFETPMGSSSSSSECSVTLGNGGYSVSSDNDKVVPEIDTESGIITLTATSGKEEYTATVTVTDCSSLTAYINVNVKPTFEAFTQSDLDMILAKDNSDWYIKSSLFSQTLNTDLPRYERYGEWKDVAEDDQYIFGWWEDDHDSYTTRSYGGHVIFYPAGTTLNQEVEATYQFKYNRGSSYPIYKLNGKAKVIKDDENVKVVIWWNVDMENECIDRGWIVRKK